MTLHLHSTHLVAHAADGHTDTVWEGVTGDGTPVSCLIASITEQHAADHDTLAAELEAG